ncbi:hypothetical protein AB2B41_09645 [Marimonas sp. MJW-29]|uniref:Rhodanese domain-containing protein n=1 Tax=Sulfitobacter sediminis TaxID=3234186 RepID=A0ABV3RLL5_9RHOB
MHGWTTGVSALLILVAGASAAEEKMTEAKASFIFNGERIRIARDNADAARFVTAFASLRDACGAACVAPMQVAQGVATLGEVEVLNFLVNEVAGNAGLMVDARLQQDRAMGFIPGSVSLPHSAVDPDNGFRDDVLRALGAVDADGGFDFTQARQLLIYDLGPGSDDAGSLVRNLLTVGYPAGMLRYYRGGMQMWSLLGFSIEEGQS